MRCCGISGVFWQGAMDKPEVGTVMAMLCHLLLHVTGAKKATFSFCTHDVPTHPPPSQFNELNSPMLPFSTQQLPNKKIGTQIFNVQTEKLSQSTEFNSVHR